MASSADFDRASDSQSPSPGDQPRPGSAPAKTRVWTYLLAITLAAIVGSCCLCGVLLMQQWPSFQQDPAAAEALTHQMLALEIPEVFEPQGTIEWNVLFVLTMRGAYYTHQVGDGELTLLKLDSPLISQPDFRQHVIDALRQNGAGSGFDLNVLQSETRTFGIAGEQVPFQFLRAEDRTTGEERRLIDGVVTGKQGPVLVALWFDEDIWDEELVTRLIQSIGEETTP
jgi:hypothetical protein